MTTGYETTDNLSDRLDNLSRKMRARTDEMAALERKPTLTAGDRERFDNINGRCGQSR